MKFFRPLEWLYPISKAIKDIADNYDKKGSGWKHVNSKSKWRFRIWSLREWLHIWRWKGFYKLVIHRYKMWMHFHNFRCRCVSHYKRTGKHSEECPKSKWKKLRKI